MNLENRETSVSSKKLGLFREAMRNNSVDARGCKILNAIVKEIEGTNPNDAKNYRDWTRHRNETSRGGWSHTDWIDHTESGSR